MTKKIKILIAGIIAYLFLTGIIVLAAIMDGYTFSLKLLQEAVFLVFIAVVFAWIVVVGVKLLYNWIEED